MNNPLVSVIIPLYNAEKSISETIYSVTSQSYYNWEIIIINDGSTDKSLSIIKSFESEKIKVISVENGGASRARNIGISIAKGDYIQFLDSDDIISHDKLRNQVALLEKYNASIVFCNTFRFDDIGSIQCGVYSRINDFSSATIQLSTEDFLYRLFIKDGIKMIAVHAFLVKRSLILSAGTWNENISLDDDGEFFFRVYLKVDRILYDSLSICFYRFSNINSLSNTSLIKGLKSEFESIESKKYHLLNSNRVSGVRKKQILRNIQSIYLYKYFLLRNCKEYKTFYDDLFCNNSGFNKSLWPRKITRFLSYFISFDSIIILKSIHAYFKKNYN